MISSRRSRSRSSRSSNKNGIKKVPIHCINSKVPMVLLGYNVVVVVVVVVEVSRITNNSIRNDINTCITSKFPDGGFVVE